MGQVGIVAFTFGTPYTLRTNQFISRLAFQKARRIDAPVYTQLDIDSSWGFQQKTTYTPEIAGHAPPTLRICRGAVQWAKQLSLSELWIVCARPHLWRCKKDLEYAIHEAAADISIHVCEEIKEESENFWYCPESAASQWYTRSRLAWLVRDSILRALCFFNYSIYRRIAR